MKAQEFVAFANRIALSSGANAAEWRSSVSRAYYGVLHTALELLADAGVPCPAGANPHHYVKVHLQQSGLADAIVAGQLIGDLHHERVLADYKLKLAKAETKIFAILNIKRADAILNKLAACDSPAAKTLIQQGILAYRAKLGPP